MAVKKVFRWLKLAPLIVIFFLPNLLALGKTGVKKKKGSANHLRLMSMSVGRVNEHTVTSREVKLNYILELALYNPKKLKSVPVGLEIKSKEFRKELSGTLLSWVVFYESKGFSISQISRREVNRAVKAVKKATKKNRAWRGLEVSQEETVRFVRKKLRVKKFIRFRAEASEVAISDQEAEKHFEANQAQFGTQSFKKIKRSIKVLLRRQQVKKRLRVWFDVLKAKYKVQNYLFD